LKEAASRRACFLAQILMKLSERRDESTEQKGDLKRQLSFRDVFFLSFGGQSPLLSILTYGAVALSLAGYLGPIAVLLATLVVLGNGLVAHRLARRFTASGGYFTYAIHSLSQHAGLQTGWMYFFYSLLFGSAYVTGSAFVINYVFGISPALIALAITIPAFIFLMMGARPSAKYALLAGSIEMAVLAGFIIVSIYFAKFSFYSPVSPAAISSVPLGSFALAVLFAIGIPTGFCSIIPISGEILNAEKVVGRVAVSAIVIGGVLSALFVYGLTDLLVAKGVNIFGAAAGGGGLAVIDLVNKYFGSFGRDFTLILAIGTINDGVLAALSLGAATSRTVFKMGLEGALPGLFSKQRGGKPFFANLFAGLGIVLISTLILVQMSAPSAFTALGTVSLFGVLFIYLTSNLSLMRVSIRRLRRKLFGGLRGSLSNYAELLLALSAAIMTTLVLLFSMSSSSLTYVAFFLAWIVFGYIFIDVKDIVFQAQSRGRGKKYSGAVWERVSALTAVEIKSELPDVYVHKSDTVKVALDKCLNLDSPAAVVLDERDQPVGTILLHDIVGLETHEVATSPVREYALNRVAKVDANEKALNLAEVFSNTGLPIVAIVDIHGKFIGTVREREIIRRLASVQESYFD
jgi:amino acid transporter